jgi:hypothetical protein
MRSYRSYLALLVVALAATGVVVVACGETAANCQQGTIALTVQFYGTALSADNVEISCGNVRCTIPTPDMATFDMSGGHGDNAGVAVFDISFPAGYPTDTLVVVTVTARGGTAGTLLGQASANIHLPPGCTTGYLSVTGGAIPDASVAD